MGARVLIVLSALGALGTTPPAAPKQCEPAPVVKPVAGLAPNSTYINSSEPPERFLRQMPAGHIKVAFGREMIDKHCGVPPCNHTFNGCVRGDLLVVPDPRDPDFDKIMRHEIAHFNGWPATHGD